MRHTESKPLAFTRVRVWVRPWGPAWGPPSITRIPGGVRLSAACSELAGGGVAGAAYGQSQTPYQPQPQGAYQQPQQQQQGYYQPQQGNYQQQGDYQQAPYYGPPPG